MQYQLTNADQKLYMYEDNAECGALDQSDMTEDEYAEEQMLGWGKDIVARLMDGDTYLDEEGNEVDFEEGEQVKLSKEEAESEVYDLIFRRLHIFKKEEIQKFLDEGIENHEQFQDFLSMDWIEEVE
jgi:hypothetical protein